MYRQYFGLKEAPFSIAVDPRYLFMSARHREALAHLLYGVGLDGGFVLLTGEVGTGKTTLNRLLLEQLPDTTDVALVLNPALKAAELLATVCDELHIQYDPGEQSLKILTDKLHRFLLENYSRDRNTVLLIDEAQHLQFEVLEQIRLLTNLETNTRKLLQIILVGQPELRAILSKPELQQLAQRITARYQLKPLNLIETKEYIAHRLAVAGLPANQVLFPDDVIKGLHKVSRGVPRVINVLCDRMLLGTYGKHKTTVDRSMLKQATIEVMGDEDDVHRSSAFSILPKLTGTVSKIAAVLALLAVTSLATIYLGNSYRESAVAQFEVESAAAGKTQASTEPKNHSTAGGQSANDNPQPWYADKSGAFDELAMVLDSGENLCSSSEITNYQCETLHASSWQDLLGFNRYAVLTLVTRSKFTRYAVLLKLQETQALVSYQGRTQTIDLGTLGQLWTGEFVFPWQPPSAYNGPISKGDSSPMVTWLAVQFAEIDQQQTALTDKVFNTALQQRVKIFQREKNLQADGIVGLKTLLALMEQIGAANTLNSNTPYSKPRHDGDLHAISIPDSEARS